MLGAGIGVGVGVDVANDFHNHSSQKEKFGPGTLLVRQQQVVVKQTIEDSSQAIEGYKMVEHLKDSVGAGQLHSNRQNNL